MMKNQKINFNLGTITFWIPNNLFKFNDNQSHILVKYSNAYGSIFIVKDEYNKLKFSHVITGQGRTDVEIDVSDLDSMDNHMIAASWDVAKKQIKLYIDGNKKYATTNIKY
ncbi:hypothetical protein KAS41_02665 [Candidatus Parcubacteria bacterium]|nr:hypothetical protein [Candidatus Parcubacteria bacterium]